MLFSRFLSRALTIALLAAGWLALLPPGDARALPPGAPVVVELYTSQGCNTCPPADAMLRGLADQPNVIALSLHVDYWDYLGWKDDLSLPGHAQRQSAYARRMGQRQVYTPQVVVNGRWQVVGSDRPAVVEAIRSARARPQIPLTLNKPIQGFDGWKVALPATTLESGETAVRLVFCRFEREHEVSILRGENAGQTFRYVNAVRQWMDLGPYDGSAQQVALPGLAGIDWERDGAVLLLQSKGGPMLGALDLSPEARRQAR